jgi:hypothetical protein
MKTLKKTKWNPKSLKWNWNQFYIEKVNLVSVLYQSWNWNLGMIPNVFKEYNRGKATIPTHFQWQNPNHPVLHPPGSRTRTQVWTKLELGLGNWVHQGTNTSIDTYHNLVHVQPHCNPSVPVN